MARWGGPSKTPIAPADPPRLLPGPTAIELVRCQTKWLVAGVAVLPLIGVGSMLMQPLRTIVILAGMALLVFCAVRAARAAISEMRAEARERTAGYTTLPVSRYRHLWQLDDKTGDVIRPPIGAAASPRDRRPAGE